MSDLNDGEASFLIGTFGRRRFIVIIRSMIAPINQRPAIKTKPLRFLEQNHRSEKNSLNSQSILDISSS